MPKAIQISAFGGVERLRFVEAPTPEPEAGEVVVRVVAAGVNPGEIMIREGALADVFPMDFPFGQGSDFAGRVAAVGAGVDAFAVGDEVLGWSDGRSAQAEDVVVPAEQLIPKPAALDWYRAGGLRVVAATAVGAVRAIAPKPGETVVVSGAAGGVGALAVQLALREGARVLGVAGAGNARFLRSLGVEPIVYGDGLEARLRAAAPDGVDAFLDLFGDGYVDLALRLCVAPARVNTIIDFAAAERHGISADGAAAAADRETLARVADLVAWGDLVMPLAAIYPFAMVREAYEELARRRARGKIVLAIEGGPNEPRFPAAR